MGAEAESDREKCGDSIGQYVWGNQQKVWVWVEHKKHEHDSLLYEKRDFLFREFPLLYQHPFFKKFLNLTGD